MNDGRFLFGAAMGIGVGYVNASLLGMPGWVNITVMFGLAIGAAFKRGASA